LVNGGICLLVSKVLIIVIRSNGFEEVYFYDDGVKNKMAYRKISEEQYG